MSNSVKILQPISMNSVTSEIILKNDVKEAVIECLLCDKTFASTENGASNPILAHLLSVHKIVIADVQKICNFPKYISYWKNKFSTTTDLKDFCVLIKSNTAENDKAPSEDFYLLTDFLPEDHDIRNELKTEKLVSVLNDQQHERHDTSFSKTCLFCKDEFHGNRAMIFRHMAKDHSFNVGNPENIVHASEFLDLIKSKLDSFTCLCCEKQFKNWTILKDHMRKKGHKRIDPKNKEYDKYYLINYLAPGKNWKDVKSDPEYEKEDSAAEDSNAEKEWGEWKEEKGMISLCLFCTETEQDVEKTLSHMKDVHKFSLRALKQELDLTFYDQVKIVNFIRKKVFELHCPVCLQKCESRDRLESHFYQEQHYGIPTDKTVWDQPGYFFPTFDDDSLLCFLEDDSDEDKDENKNRIMAPPASV